MEKDPSHNDNGFRLPEGYFDGLEDRIRERMQIRETEAELPDTEGFSVPEGYFDGLESKILSKTVKPEPKVVNLRTRMQWIYSAAAVITAALIGTWMLLNHESTDGLDGFRTADIEWLLDQGMLEIPTGYLEEQSQLSDLAQLSMSETLQDKDLLEEYLSSEADLYEVIE